MNKSAMKRRLGVVQLHGGGARELLTKEIIIKLAFEIWLVFFFFPPGREWKKRHVRQGNQFGKGIET